MQQINSSETFTIYMRPNDQINSAPKILRLIVNECFISHNLQLSHPYNFINTTTHVNTTNEGGSLIKLCPTAELCYRFLVTGHIIPGLNAHSKIQLLPPSHILSDLILNLDTQNRPIRVEETFKEPAISFMKPNFSIESRFSFGDFLNKLNLPPMSFSKKCYSAWRISVVDHIFRYRWPQIDCL